MNTTYQFQGKCVVVTGGAQGIGFQIAKDFLTAGAKVSLWDYSKQDLETAKKELGQFGDSVHCAEVDVSKAASCQAAAGQLPFNVDVLINNAGITRDKSFKKMTQEEFDGVISTNLTGVFNVTKSLLEKFNATSTQKRIVNIASVVALYGNFGQANYVASKAGVIGMTKTLAREFARGGFTVNAVAPGFTRTRMVAKMPQEVLDKMIEKVPVGRLGEPADISHACLFLASEEAGYINGTVLSVDGGIVC